VLLFATAWILWYLWVNSQMRIFSGVRVLILVGRKKGDEFTYIEVFKRLIASGDGDDAIIEGCIL